MFESFFGKKKSTNGREGKGSGKPAIDGVAHFDGSSEKPEFYSDKHKESGAIESDQDGFDKEKVKDEIKKGKRNWYWDDDFSKGKVSNERKKPKLGEARSDHKEKGVFDTPKSKDEIDDENLEAIMEHEATEKSMRDYYGDYEEEEDHKEAA